jgi:hypothetical protein
LKYQEQLNHYCSVLPKKTRILDYNTVTATKLKVIITHAISRVLVMCCCWSAVFTVCVFVKCGIELTVIEFHREAE